MAHKTLAYNIYCEKKLTEIIVCYGSTATLSIAKWRNENISCVEHMKNVEFLWFQCKNSWNWRHFSWISFIRIEYLTRCCKIPNFPWYMEKTQSAPYGFCVLISKPWMKCKLFSLDQNTALAHIPFLTVNHTNFLPNWEFLIHINWTLNVVNDYNHYGSDWNFNHEIHKWIFEI